MALEGLASSSEVSQAFMDTLQNDLKNLSTETKKKYPQIKEVTWRFCGFVSFLVWHVLQSCEEAINKLKNASSTPQTPIYYVINQIMYPLVQGCDTKDIKIIRVCSTRFWRDYYWGRFIFSVVYKLCSALLHNKLLIRKVLGILQILCGHWWNLALKRLKYYNRLLCCWLRIQLFMEKH